MGAFSWCKIDSQMELMEGQMFTFLVPQEFGGKTIITRYDDYGNFRIGDTEYDIYEIIAAWNSGDKSIKYDKYGLIPVNPNTDHNRGEGINIAVYDNRHAMLKYPVRIIEPHNEDCTYEDYEGMFSISAPDQGWNSSTIYDELRFQQGTYLDGDLPRFNDDTEDWYEYDELDECDCYDEYDFEDELDEELDF